MSKQQITCNTSSCCSSNIQALACVLLIPTVSGGYIYSFGLYANELKNSLQLNQAELTTLSSAIFGAGALQFLPGLIVDKYGERLSLLIGGQVGGIVMFLYWMIATKYIIVKQEWLVSILCALTVTCFLSNSLLTGAVFKVIMKLCSDGKHKGTIVGVAKGHIGLGAGVFAALFSSLHRESSLDLLLLVAAAFVIFGAVIPYFLIPSIIEPTSSHLTSNHLYSLYMGMLTLATLVLGQSLWALSRTSDSSFMDATKRHSPDYAQFLLMASAWIGPIVSMLFLKRPAQQSAKLEHESLLSRSVEKAEHRSFSLVEMLQTLPAWLLVWTLTMLAGAGVTVTQNVGQMVIALEMSARVTSAALAIFSVSSAASRVAMGALSEILSNRGIPRPVLLLQAALSATVAHACLAMSSNVVQFLVSIALCGAAYGMYHPILILICGDIFGPNYLASNFLFLSGVTLSAGSILVNKGISQYVYEQHIATEQGSACIGRGCFGNTHWITAALCLTSIFTCFCLLCTKLTRQAYSNAWAHEK